MTTSAETLYTFWTPYPDILQAGRAARVEMRVYRDGALVAPTQAGSSLTLLKPDGTAIFTARAVTVASSIAYVDITAGELPTTLPLGEGYQEVWTLVLADRTETVDREAAVCVRALQPACTDRDLLDEYPNLNVIRGTLIDSYQGFLDSAWREIIERLFQEGHLPYLIKSGWVFRVPQRELALAKAWNFFAGAQPKGNYLELSKKHEDRYNTNWSRITWTTDDDHDGRVDDPSARVGGSGSVVHVNAAGAWAPRHDPRW